MEKLSADLVQLGLAHDPRMCNRYRRPFHIAGKILGGSTDCDAVVVSQTGSEVQEIAKAVQESTRAMQTLTDTSSLTWMEPFAKSAA